MLAFITKISRSYYYVPYTVLSPVSSHIPAEEQRYFLSSILFTILKHVTSSVSISLRTINKTIGLYKTLCCGEQESYTFRLCKTTIFRLRIWEVS